MSPPLERVGGRGPSERALLRVVVVVLAAALLAVVKPWGDGTGVGGGTARGSAQAASCPRSRRPSGRPRCPTPVDPASTFCLAPSGWRLTSLEVFDRQTIRVWQTIDPVQASGPTDPALPEGLVVSTSVLAVGWCAPTAPDVRPDRSGHDPDLARPVERGAGGAGPPATPRPELPSARTTGRRTSARATADWTPGRYVFAISEAAPGRSWWFAVTVRRFVPDAPETPTDAPASPVP